MFGLGFQRGLHTVQYFSNNYDRSAVPICWTMMSTIEVNNASVNLTHHSRFRTEFPSVMRVSGCQNPWGEAERLRVLPSW